MKLFAKSLLSVVAAVLFLTSCGGGNPATSNPDIAKMSDTTQKALDTASKSLCGCLKDHGSGLKEFGKELKEVIAEMEKASDEDKMAVMGKMMGAMGKMKDFGGCMDKAKPSGEDEKAMEEDMKKLVGEDADKKTRTKKTFEILQVYLDKNCPSDAKTFKEFVASMEDLEKLKDMR